MRKRKILERLTASLIIVAMLVSCFSFAGTEYAGAGQTQTEAAAEEQAALDVQAEPQEGEGVLAEEPQEAVQEQPEAPEEAAQPQEPSTQQGGEAPQEPSAQQGDAALQEPSTQQKAPVETEEVFSWEEAGPTEQSTERQQAENTEGGLLEAPEQSKPVKKTPDITAVEDYTGLMSEEELEQLSEDEVGATMWGDDTASAASPLRMMRAARAAEERWSFDLRYVGQPDNHYAKITEDGTLKYQMSFHAGSRQYAPGRVVIRIPNALLANKNGTQILAADIAVPKVDAPLDVDQVYQKKGEEDNGIFYLNGCVENRSTSFNYYIDGNDLVFFNYKTIAKGSNGAWQVLYKDINLMNIKDGTTWDLAASITVTNKETQQQDPDTTPIDVWVPEEPFTPEHLTGEIDSSVRLTSVTKQAYSIQGKNYAPGLYTDAQLAQFVDAESLPEGLSAENYMFVVWDIRVAGRANQEWDLMLKDVTMEELGGFIVGYQDNSADIVSNKLPIQNVTVSALPGEDGYRDLGDDYKIFANQKVRNFESHFYAVTAYPKDTTAVGTTLKNDLTVSMKGVDGVDEAEEKSASDDWIYENYVWKDNGNLFDVKKTTPEWEKGYPGWLDVYEKGGEDYTEIPFTSTLSSRSYSGTHTTNSADGEMGKYVEGTEFRQISTDDIMYIRDITGLNDGELRKSRILTKDDYYYSKISVRQTDVGLDIWEDMEAAPEFQEGIDYNVEIYAMYANGNGWELAASVPMELKDGQKVASAEYQFTSTQIAREPYRVKAEYTTTNYRSVCTIDVNVRMKSGENAILTKIMNKYREECEQEKDRNAANVLSMRIENTCGVYGYQTMQDGTVVSKEYDMPETGDSNYSQYEKFGVPLADQTREIHEFDGEGVLIWRDYTNKMGVKVTTLESDAGSFKNWKGTNDPNNSRVLVNYKLTAYDGYKIYSMDALDYLKQFGTGDEDAVKILSPGRNKVVFYDLLPYGVHFDPSYKVTAGWIEDLKTRSGSDFRNSTGYWNTNQVSVRVDNTETVENYKGTGRTLVKFHITYTGADATTYSNGMWAEGWGVDFRAYYDWKDIYMVKNEANISAFMNDLPVEGSETYDEDYAKYMTPLCGPAKRVAKDNGEIPSGQGLDACAAFGGNIDGNSDNDDILSVLYAQETSKDDVAQAFQDGVTKTVRADSDVYGTYGEMAIVEPGKGYTYELTVSTAAEDARNVVIYDKLEEIGGRRWHGTLHSVVTTGLEAMGFTPKVYYYIDKDATVTDRSYPDIPLFDPQKGESGNKPELTEELPDGGSGWVLRENYNSRMDKITAVAVDLGQDSVLSASMHSVSFQIKMTAPKKDAVDGNEAVLNEYTYNEPLYYREHTGVGANKALTKGNRVQVAVSEYQIYELTKTLDDSVPASAQDTAFEFKVAYAARYNKDGELISPGKVLAYQVYTLYDADGNPFTDRIYATDGDGCLTLRKGQKARFENMPSMEEFEVTELTAEENLFWEIKDEKKEEMEEGQGDAAKKKLLVTIENGYRPMLYVQKKVSGVPEDKADEAKDTEFVFQVGTAEGISNQIAARLTGNYTPLGDGLEGLEKDNRITYYYVRSIPASGGIPSVIMENGARKEGKLEEGGLLRLKAGETVVLFPGKEGTKYQVEELGVLKNVSADSSALENLDDSNWTCSDEERTQSGELAVDGSSVTVTNYYKWKELVLAKELTNQKTEDCEVPFTFLIEKEADGTPIQNASWRLVKKNGQDLSAEEKAELEDRMQGKSDFALSGEIDGATGKFTAYCAGYAVRVDHLEAQTAYLLTELIGDDELEANPELEDYKIMTGSQQVAVSLRGTEASATVVNDYLYRPLKVTKTVIYDENDAVKPEEPENPGGGTGDGNLSLLGASRAGEGGEPDAETGDADAQTTEPQTTPSDPNAREFTMLVTVNGEPISGERAKYTVTEDGKEVEKTAENGLITLKNGQTATFAYAGKAGDAFEVKEQFDPLFPQISPVGDTSGLNQGDYCAPFTGEISDRGDSAALIVNGKKGFLMIRKEYVGVNEEGENFLDEIQTWLSAPEPPATADADEVNEWRINKTIAQQRLTLLKVNFTLEVDGAPWPEYDTPVYVLDRNGVLQNGTRTWEAGQTLDVEPWQTVLVPLDEDASYQLSESENDQHRLIDPSNLAGELLSYPQGDGGQVVQPMLSGRTGGIIAKLKAAASSVIANFKAANTAGDGAAGQTEREVKTIYEVDQSEPTGNAAFEGDVKSSPLAVIKNALKAHTIQASIGKAMAFGSDKVPAGSRLTWRVQEYNGGRWTEAKDVEYRVNGGSTQPSDQFFKTDGTGTIELTRVEGGMPQVEFSERVFINLYKEEDIEKYSNELKEGERLLRIVEVPGLSNESWGLLAGFCLGGIAENVSDAESSIRDTDVVTEMMRSSAVDAKAGLNQATGGNLSTGFKDKSIGCTTEGVPFYGLDLSPRCYGAFVNSNRLVEVEIAKELTEGSDNDEFTIVLRHVISTSFDQDNKEKKVTKESEIIASEPRKDITYRIYDPENEHADRYGYLPPQKTDATGVIKLKGGQHAKVYLPEKTMWTVHEDVLGTGYDLVDLTPSLEQEVPGMTRLLDAQGKEAVDKVLIHSEGEELRELHAAFRQSRLAQDNQVNQGVLDLLGSDRTVDTKRMVNQHNTQATSAAQRQWFVGNKISRRDLTAWVLSTATGRTDVEINEINTITLTGPGIDQNAPVELPTVPSNNKTPLQEGQYYTFVKAGKYNLHFVYADGKAGSPLETDLEFVVGGYAEITAEGIEQLKYRPLGSEEPYDWRMKDEPLDLVIPPVLEFKTEEGIWVPAYVVKIGAQAFRYTNIEGAETGRPDIWSVSFPETLQEIGYQAFAGCQGIRNITIPNSVNKIDAQAFEGCGEIETVQIGNDPTTSLMVVPTEIEIGAGAFIGSQIDRVVIADCKKAKIATQAFNGCMISELHLGGTVLIGSYAFSACHQLREVQIPNSVSTIGDNAFNGCVNLTKVEIGSEETTEKYPITIGASAFVSEGFSRLTTVIIHDWMAAEIGKAAFKSCKIENLELGGTVLIGDEAFSGESGYGGKIDLVIPGSVKFIGNSAFADWHNIGTLTIENGLESIGENAFHDCTGMISASIPESVTAIGADAFSWADSLMTITVDKPEGSIEGAPWGWQKYINGNWTNQTVTWLR